MEPETGMAAVFLSTGELNSALGYVNKILNHLETAQTSAGVEQQDRSGVIPGLEGTRDPMWIYSISCQVLSAEEDSRMANLLEVAHHLIQTQAKKISDPDLQFSFLNNVKSNQEIQALFQLGEPW
jgi:hypothetical protein